MREDRGGHQLPPRTPHNRRLRIIAHVGMAKRQMYFHACRDDNHDAFSLPASCRFTAAGLLPAGAKTRRPSSSSIAILPSGGFTRSRKAASAGTSFAMPSLSATVASCGAFRAVRPNWTRQRNAFCSRRFHSSTSPDPSQAKIFKRSARFERKTKIVPENGSWRSCSRTSAARPSAPLRLCGAPHNRNYAEPTIMRSARPLNPRPASLSTV